MEMAFLEDEVIMFGLKMLKKKPRSKQQGALIAETHQALQELSGLREDHARELLGPRGGLPRTKGELVKLALLCNVEIKDTDTNEQIKLKIKPTVDLIINKKKSTGSSAASPSPMKPSTHGLIPESKIGIQDQDQDQVSHPSTLPPLPAFQDGLVPWGMTVGPEGQPTFMETVEETKDWVMTPEFYQMHDETDPQL